jgi:arylformamidase
LENLDIEPGDALLFKTDNSVSGRCRNGVFSENFVYLSSAAANFCVEEKIRLVGIDYISIEKYGDEAFPSHRKILGNNILILEGIDLKEAPQGRYTLICLPLTIKDGEASPVRAILLQ